MGIGAVTAVAMVVLYSLLPILKNTCTGLRNISADTLEAAKGIGMTDMQVLFKVRLPLALPVIMAGIRISSVTAVGLMTIAAYIGAGGLGTLVISGIQTDNPNMILLSGAFNGFFDEQGRNCGHTCFTAPGFKKNVQGKPGTYQAAS